MRSFFLCCNLIALRANRESAESKTMRFGIFVYILFEIFYLSEGKPCREKTRPHKTRCEAFYKCTELPSKRLVWVPEKCESGLVYERHLGLCVLPDDDWECTLGVNAPKKEKLINPVNEYKIHITKAAQATLENKRNDSVVLKDDTNEYEIELAVDGTISSEEEVEHEDNKLESSGDGELVEVDGFLQAENRETEDWYEKQEDAEVANEIRQEAVRKKSKIDPKLTAQLQRLSQLIDGLKDQYQKDDAEQTNLRPDQLNAFLAHFNIQNKYNLIEPTVETNSMDIKRISTTIELPASTTTSGEHETATKNNTSLENHSDNKLEPETKVVLTNALPKHYEPTGYSNSHIVVNRPEGSVLFPLPNYAINEGSSQYGQNTPEIPDDTLKTVLELSKQMIATQNIPKIVPNPSYYAQPFIQPLFLPASTLQTQDQASPFASYFSLNNQGQLQQTYHTSGSRNQYNPYAGSYNNLSAQQQQLHPASSYNKPGNTIIHNNIIPVHVTSTSSGEKEIVDSYGQSLGLFPPLNTDAGNSYHQHYHLGVNKYLNNLTTARPQISTSITNYAAQYPSQFPTQLGATTTRPANLQPTTPTLTEYFSPSPHLNDNNVNKLFQPTDRYPTVQYDELPHPINLRHPSLFTPQINTNRLKIRPNDHKIESMEIEADGNGDNHAHAYSQTYTYNYDNDKLDTSVNNPYQEASYGMSASSSSITGNKHTYVTRPSSVAAATRPSYTNTANKLSKPYNEHTSSSSFSDGTQLVNVGGNFVSFDVFQNTILPLVGQTQSINDLNNVEVITCTMGVRQPNTTDCTRYYVCSKKDGKVLSYSCPPYTAFNAQSRICDAHTYALCAPDALMGSYTVMENKRLQMEALKVLQHAKRRQAQAIKAQNIANLIQKYGSQTHSAQTSEENTSQVQDDDSSERDMLNAYVQQAAAMSIYSTTPKPNGPQSAKKRKYYCKEGDKIVDQTSIYSYFVCYKNAEGMMKGHKMTCTKGLIFCAKTSLCTLTSKCT
ncbi:uncharacterized protein [Eurosta solidaginis]|uniref:uncharacterized protein n=1 Tax=Eurosta solidaginis TaxID=178769 RepID=UPI003530C14D